MHIYSEEEKKEEGGVLVPRFRKTERKENVKEKKKLHAAGTNSNSKQTTLSTRYERYLEREADDIWHGKQTSDCLSVTVMRYVHNALVFFSSYCVSCVHLVYMLHLIHYNKIKLRYCGETTETWHRHKTVPSSWHKR